jgi:hypothetical protein
MMHDASSVAAMEAHWGGGAAPFGASWQKTSVVVRSIGGAEPMRFQCRFHAAPLLLVR